MASRRFKVLMILLGLSTALLPIGPGSHASAPVHAQADSRFFAETGHAVRGRFLKYWEEHGGLAQQGYPISDEMQERSDSDGKTYAVQYFERAVFEWHPENQAPYDVLLSLVGVFYYKEKYPQGAPDQKANTDPATIYFPETGKRLGGSFREYWQSRGGLMQQGYPISDEFHEKSDLDGKTYTVQYFERAVFEWHPENKGTPYEVLLSQLGTFRYKARHAASQPPAIPRPAAGRTQFGAAGSNSYLVWGEAASDPDSYDIMGIDLQTRQPLVVSNAPKNQFNPAISGSMVVWEDEQSSCYPCGRDIVGKDLASGTVYQVATGPNDQLYPAIWGKSVAWIENAEHQTKLMVRELEETQSSSSIMEVRTIPYEQGIDLLWPRISDHYLIWAEQSRANPSTGVRQVSLEFFDRKKGTTRSITEFDVPRGGGFEYALDAHLAVWSDPTRQLYIADLNTPEISKLCTCQAYTPDVKGDVVVWSAPGAISGIHLKDRQPQRLVAAEAGRAVMRPIIAGEWLVWQNDDGYLGIGSLSEAFSQAP